MAFCVEEKKLKFEQNDAMNVHDFLIMFMELLRFQEQSLLSQESS